MLVLGIETSCDETSAAVVENGIKVHSNIVASQVVMHAKWGGVVPEAAARMHVERLNPVIQEALDVAKIGFNDLNAIAVTNRPGLVGALVVGAAAAKTLSYALNLPLIGINHLEGHLCSALLAKSDIQTLYISLIISGGHTELILVKQLGDYVLLGETMDDAAGEAFDKCARLFGLGYPGGSNLEKLAASGNPIAYGFPRSKMGDSYNFSFSGLKSAVARFVENSDQKYDKADAAASFQEAVIDVLVLKSIKACLEYQVKTLTVVGGVSANQALKTRITTEADKHDIEVITPPFEYCTDNAAMIASAGFFRLQMGEQDNLELDCYASSPITANV